MIPDSYYADKKKKRKRKLVGRGLKGVGKLAKSKLGILSIVGGGAYLGGKRSDNQFSERVGTANIWGGSELGWYWDMGREGIEEGPFDTRDEAKADLDFWAFQNLYSLGTPEFKAGEEWYPVITSTEEFAQHLPSKVYVRISSDGLIWYVEFGVGDQNAVQEFDTQLAAIKFAETWAIANGYTLLQTVSNTEGTKEYEAVLSGDVFQPQIANMPTGASLNKEEFAEADTFVHIVPTIDEEFGPGWLIKYMGVEFGFPPFESMDEAKVGAIEMIEGEMLGPGLHIVPGKESEFPNKIRVMSASFNKEQSDFRGPVDDIISAVDRGLMPEDEAARRIRVFLSRQGATTHVQAQAEVAVKRRSWRTLGTILAGAGIVGGFALGRFGPVRALRGLGMNDSRRRRVIDTRAAAINRRKRELVGRVWGVTPEERRVGGTKGLWSRFLRRVPRRQRDIDDQLRRAENLGSREAAINADRFPTGRTPLHSARSILRRKGPVRDKVKVPTRPDPDRGFVLGRKGFVPKGAGGFGGSGSVSLGIENRLKGKVAKAIHLRVIVDEKKRTSQQLAEIRRSLKSFDVMLDELMTAGGYVPGTTGDAQRLILSKALRSGIYTGKWSNNPRYTFSEASQFDEDLEVYIRANRGPLDVTIDKEPGNLGWNHRWEWKLQGNLMGSGFKTKQDAVANALGWVQSMTPGNLSPIVNFISPTHIKVMLPATDPPLEFDRDEDFLGFADNKDQFAELPNRVIIEIASSEDDDFEVWVIYDHAGSSEQTHDGPYETNVEAVRSIERWAILNNYSLTGPERGAVMGNPLFTARRDMPVQNIGHIATPRGASLNKEEPVQSDFRRFYHLTATQNVASILRDGIKSSDAGASSWLSGIDSVWVGDDPKTLWKIVAGDILMGHNVTDPVSMTLLSVDIPRRHTQPDPDGEDITGMIGDKDYNPAAARTVGASQIVNPALIKVVETRFIGTDREKGGIRELPRDYVGMQSRPSDGILTPQKWWKWAGSTVFAEEPVQSDFRRFYHLTATENVQSILQNGIEASDVGGFFQGESVWVGDDPKTLWERISGWIMNGEEEEASITLLSVDVPRRDTVVDEAGYDMTKLGVLPGRARTVGSGKTINPLTIRVVETRIIKPEINEAPDDVIPEWKQIGPFQKSGYFAEDKIAVLVEHDGEYWVAGGFDDGYHGPYKEEHRAVQQIHLMARSIGMAVVNRGPMVIDGLNVEGFMLRESTNLNFAEPGTISFEGVSGIITATADETGGWWDWRYQLVRNGSPVDLQIGSSLSFDQISRDIQDNFIHGWGVIELIHSSDTEATFRVVFPDQPNVIRRFSEDQSNFLAFKTAIVKKVADGEYSITQGERTITTKFDSQESAVNYLRKAGIATSMEVVGEVFDSNEQALHVLLKGPDLPDIFVEHSFFVSPRSGYNIVSTINDARGHINSTRRRRRRWRRKIKRIIGI